MSQDITLSVHRLMREYLFWLCALWTLCHMTLLLLEYLGVDRVAVPPAMPVYNFLLIAVYAGVKEGARWAHRRLGKKRGEYFFYLWWLFALALLLGFVASRGRWTVPDALFPNLWFVSIVFVGSVLSRLVHTFVLVEVRLKRRHGRNHAVRPAKR